MADKQNNMATRTTAGAVEAMRAEIESLTKKKTASLETVDQLDSKIDGYEECIILIEKACKEECMSAGAKGKESSSEAIEEAA